MKPILICLTAFALALAALAAPTSPVVVNPNTSVLVTPTAAQLASANGLALSASAQPLHATLTSLAALTNGAGVLTNNGSGGLSWAASAGGLTIGNSTVSGAAANDLLISNGTVLQKLTPGAGVAAALGAVVVGNGSIVLENGAVFQNAVTCLQFQGVAGVLGAPGSLRLNGGDPLNANGGDVDMSGGTASGTSAGYIDLRGGSAVNAWGGSLAMGGGSFPGGSLITLDGGGTLLTNAAPGNNGITSFNVAATKTLTLLSADTFTLQAIASGNVVVQGGALGTPASGVVTNLTGTGGFNTTGNAATATALATARTIGGSGFDGSANVTSFPAPGAIGGTTPSTGAFTTVTGTSFNGLALTIGGGASTSNVVVGASAFTANTTGISNAAVGTGALTSNQSGNNNSAFGRGVLGLVVSGSDNTAAGHNAGASTTGTGSLFLGKYAGAYETGGAAFYVDAIDRSNTAGDKASALLYGTFNATASSQQLTANIGTLNLQNANGSGTITVATTNTTATLFNTTVTTVSAFGAAVSLNIGAATGTLTVNNATLAAKAITGTTLATSGLHTASGGVTVSGSALTLSGNQSAAAWTTNGIRIVGTVGTLTDTSSTGTVAAAYTNKLGGNTIAASNATTFTNYVTAYYSEPVAGTNVTFTNKWALGGDSLRAGTAGGFTVTSGGIATVAPTARTSGSASFLTITTPADTTLTASTESIGVSKTAATRQFATGALTTQREVVLAAPTYSFAAASTITTAVNVDIADPVAGTNATLTKRYGLQVGRAHFSAATFHTGDINLGPTTGYATITGNTGNFSAMNNTGKGIICGGSYFAPNNSTVMTLGLKTANYDWASLIMPTTGLIEWHSGGTTRTCISENASGVVQIGTTGANASGSLLLTNLTSSGDIAMSKTITAGGTTGAQTINKSSGTVNFAAAATSLVVTNSLCTTSSVVTATIGTNDATASGVKVVAASGSFTIYLSTAPTGETRVYFRLTN